MIKMRAKMITVGLLGAAATVPIDFAKADQLGHASWYSLPANTTANGEQMNPNDLTAAHRSLPFGTRVLVENLSNGRSVVVRINDRGPFIGGRIIDLSKAAAASIGMIAAGTAKVRVITDGGVLAALGQSTAKTKNGASVAAAPEAAVASSKMTASLAEETKADTAQPKSAAKKAKAAPKPSKTKGLAAIASGSNKRDGAQARVKVAAVAKRSKPGGTAKTRIHVAAVAKRSKPSGSAKTRIHVGGRGQAIQTNRKREDPHSRGGRLQRNPCRREAGFAFLEPPHYRGVQYASSLRRPRHNAGVHEARADARAAYGLASIASNFVHLRHRKGPSARSAGSSGCVAFLVAPRSLSGIRRHQACRRGAPGCGARRQIAHRGTG